MVFLTMIHQFLAERFNRNTIDNAIACYQKEIESDPSSPFSMATCFFVHAKGEFDQAIEEPVWHISFALEDINNVDRLPMPIYKKGHLKCPFSQGRR
jgi:hypothetical protein